MRVLRIKSCHSRHTVSVFARDTHIHSCAQVKSSEMPLLCRPFQLNLFKSHSQVKETLKAIVRSSNVAQMSFNLFVFLRWHGKWKVNNMDFFFFLLLHP